MMNANSSCFRATILRSSWRVSSSAAITRQQHATGSRAIVSSCVFSKSSPRVVARTPARGISTTSSRTKTGTRRYASHTALASVLAFSAAVSLSTLWYGRGQNSLRSDWGPDNNNKPDERDASFAAKTNGTPNRTSMERGLISFAPVGTETEAQAQAQSYFDIYEVADEESLEISKLPEEDAIFTTAPHVPPPITRDYPVLLRVPLTTMPKMVQLTSQYKYEQWTFNGTVPGPFIRARVGDVIDLTLTNRDPAGNPHNIDFHAVTGPGGGAALTTAEENETKRARFRLLCPGLYLYHCAAAPVPVHIANGMYGLIYVQPAEGNLPAVDREYYVMQSEFYHEPPEVLEDGRRSEEVEFSYPNALREEPQAVFFNGSESALTRDHPLKAHTGETVRIFFGNAGPNFSSSFHIIGSHFINLYRDGDVVSAPGHFVQTVSVPPGSATIVDMKMLVPGTYTLVDHAIFRLDKGAVGFLNVSGEPRPDIYQSAAPPAPCVGCKLHA